MMIIAVASGKGGTGKTTVATSLALAISGSSPVILDCDVEAPNAHLFLKPQFDQRQQVSMLIPEVDEGRCTGCGRCAEVCQFHAIVVLAGKVLVFPELCHGCGSCGLNCLEEAILEVSRPLGVLEAGTAMDGIRFSHGVLNVGEPMAVPVIHQLKDWKPFPNGEVIIRDAPPGTSCPVVESIRGADFAILVTEPTPFGLHDLRLAAQLTRDLDLPAGVVVNRDGVGDAGVDETCRQEGLPIMMRIPLDRHIGEAIAQLGMMASQRANNEVLLHLFFRHDQNHNTVSFPDGSTEPFLIGDVIESLIRAGIGYREMLIIVDELLTIFDTEESIAIDTVNQAIYGQLDRMDLTGRTGIPFIRRWCITKSPPTSYYRHWRSKNSRTRTQSKSPPSSMMSWVRSRTYAKLT